MPEETPQVKNKGLLLVAIVLAIVVVIIYNLHVTRIRSSLQGEQLMLLHFTRGMQVGEKITRKDVQRSPVRKDTAEQLGTVVKEESISFLIGRKLRQEVNPMQWVQWNYIQGSDTGKDGSDPGPGKVAITVELDSRAPIGPLCRPGSRINLLAFLHVPDMPPRMYRVIRNVRVLSTGMDVVEGPSGQDSARRKTTRTYRTIGLEIKEDQAPKLQNILIYADGKVYAEVLPSGTEFKETEHGIINPLEKTPLDKLLLLGKAGKKGSL